jgi:hypothetical protein
MAAFPGWCYNFFFFFSYFFLGLALRSRMLLKAISPRLQLKGVLHLRVRRLAVDAVVTFHKFSVDSTQISNTKSAMAPTG